MVKIGFFIRHFNETGTEIAIYDYADFNEKLLGNKSVILSFTEETYKKHNLGFNPAVFKKFKDRFDVLQVNDFNEMESLLEKESVDIYYTLVWGIPEEPPYGDITNKKYCVHCVFQAEHKRGDVYATISKQVNERFNTNHPVVPHIVRTGSNNNNLRAQLNIPDSAIVYGRYGGRTTFDIIAAQEAVVEVAQKNNNIYFLFMNTEKFCEETHNIIFLPGTIDLEEKKTFINTCDAFLHGRTHGETFGLSIAEFAINLKPILTSGTQFMDWAHLSILGDKAIIYSDKKNLVDILTKLDPRSVDMHNNGYLQYTPEQVIKTFKTVFIDN